MYLAIRGFIKTPVSPCKRLLPRAPFFRDMKRRYCIMRLRLSKPCTVKEDILKLEEKDATLSRNVGIRLPSDATLYPKEFNKILSGRQTRHGLRMCQGVRDWFRFHSQGVARCNTLKMAIELRNFYSLSRLSAPEYLMEVIYRHMSRR